MLLCSEIFVMFRVMLQTYGHCFETADGKLYSKYGLRFCMNNILMPYLYLAVERDVTEPFLLSVTDIVRCLLVSNTLS